VVESEDRFKPNQTAVSRRIKAFRSFKQRPSTIGLNRNNINLVPLVLSNISKPQVSTNFVEAESEWIFESKSPDFRKEFGLVDEWVVTWDLIVLDEERRCGRVSVSFGGAVSRGGAVYRGGVVSFGLICGGIAREGTYIDSKDLSKWASRVLSVSEGISKSSSISRGVIKEAIRSEYKLSAIVVLKWVNPGDNLDFTARVCVGSVGGSESGNDDVWIGVANVEPAVVRVVWIKYKTQQSSLFSIEHNTIMNVKELQSRRNALIGQESFDRSHLFSNIKPIGVAVVLNIHRVRESDIPGLEEANVGSVLLFD
jgi:hypothetical protein